MSSRARIDPEALRSGPGRYLSPRLVRRQGLDEAAVAALRGLHAEMDALKARFPSARGVSEVDALVAAVAAVEYRMQDAWGFPRDATRHTHWRLVPGCACPEGGNRPLLGVPVRLVADDCPFHGPARLGPAPVTIDGEAVRPPDEASPAAAPRRLAPGPRG